jgi:hypothetical protein
MNGIVVDKHHELDPEKWILEIELDTGRIIFWEVTQEEWDQYNAGDSWEYVAP